MFFRRQTVKKPSFSEHLDRARQGGFSVETSGAGARISRGEIAAVVEEGPDGCPRFRERAGVLLAGEIATLVDGGYQKFLQTPSGKRRPALASDLRQIHAFQEDLREALGLTSLYNESLGTVSNQYIYDRVEERDQAEPKAPWKIPTLAKPKA